MSTRITEYKCPACTAPLRFGESSGKLECEYCGGSFDLSEIETLYAGQMEDAQPVPDGTREEETVWDTSEMSNDWGPDAAGMRVYSCPSCGAELICEETTAATSCPYCGNNAIVSEQFRGALKPDYVLPFQLSKDEAVKALKEHYGKKLFLPRAFSGGNHLEEVKGIYVPFWLVDGEADADCAYHGTRSHIRREGDYRVTITEHFHVRRAGTVAFERVPVDGSRKMPDAYMDAIEPFDYSKLRPFSTAYLPGYLADKYDVSAEESMSRAETRCRNSAKAAMRADILGYETLVPVGERVQLRRGKVHYALMPVWTLHTRWQGKDYLFMVNGQSGKLVGDLPVSKGKFWGVFALLAAALSVFCMLTGMGQWIAGLF